MDEKSNVMLVLLYVMFIPVTEGAVPGTFFWKPRLGLDLSVPATELGQKVSKPTKDNIKKGIVVLIDGYSVGLTVIALASGISNRKMMPHLNPMAAHFYTNTYRWALRHLSLYNIVIVVMTLVYGGAYDTFLLSTKTYRDAYGSKEAYNSVRDPTRNFLTILGRHYANAKLPFWLGGSGGHYCDTHKAWRRRFFYMDQFVPKWMRKVLFFVDKADWEKEEKEFKRFKKYAEPAFGKHYRYPNKKYNNFNSQRTTETIENMDGSSVSIDKGR